MSPDPVIQPIVQTVQDNTVVLAIIAGIFGTINTMLGLIAIYINRTTHKLINSRMDEQLALTKTSSFAEGKLEGSSSGQSS